MFQHNNASRTIHDAARFYGTMQYPRDNRLWTPGVASSHAHAARAKEGFMVRSLKDKVQPLNGRYRVSTNQINPTSILGRVPVESCVAVNDDEADGGIKCTWMGASDEACTDFTIAFLKRLLVSSGGGVLAKA